MVMRTGSSPLAMRRSSHSAAGCAASVGRARIDGVCGLILPSELRPLDGSEALGPARVLDFWRWALGDLRMNNARGYLVEFLVGRALGDPSVVRVEWGPYDVQAADGTLVEVKATGRLQSWTTKKLSKPHWSFGSVRAERIWS